MWFLIAGQVVLAIWLVRSPQWGEGRLRWTPQGWCWLSSGRGRVDVNVTPVIDFAGLLCLRLSPLSANSTKNWPESAWVWLHDADPKTKMEFRLALHCMHGHDRSLK